MNIWRRSFVAVVVFAALAATAGDSAAQLDRLKRAAKDKAKGTAVEEAVNRATGAAGAEAETPAATATAAAGSSAAAASAKPGEGAWANYDFTPGSRILFADDFGRDEVGNFPRRLTFKSGNAEVVEWQGGRYLRATSRSELEIPLPEVLPQQFTMEFDYAGWWKEDIQIRFTDERDPVVVKLGSWGKGGLEGGGVKAISEAVRDEAGQMFRGRIMADGQYVKVYMNEIRVANVPNANLGRSNKISVVLAGHRDDPALLGNITVAAGGKKLYDELAAAGRVSTQGIFFDTGSDRIRPESTPTLKEIGEMLKAHNDLKLRIEGHTDNVGQAASNQTLSEKRAEAVRQFLVTSYGIDAARLEAAGLGASKPVTGNETPEGRQQNRRVELVKI